jgi:lysophospholipase L1-like esterase
MPLALLAGWFFATINAFAVQPPAFEWKDDDKVVLIGGTVIEREQNYGHWELALTRHIPAKNVTFRNLGWSGDTVWAESRGIFDAPEQGYAKLIELVKEQKPTVLIFGYGQVEASNGPSRIPAFLQQYKKIINDCKAGSAPGARVILLGPMDILPMPAPLPKPDSYNTQIAAYRDAIRQFAPTINATFVPMAMPKPENTKELLELTDNGQHLTSEGYARTAPQLVLALAQKSPKKLKSGDEASLQQTILKKNELFFHRHRPQNVTYLFLFRKHEQGNNAVDIPKFDPLVADLEKQIGSSLD